MKAGADVIVLDGMQGGTAATQEVFIEHVGIPTLAAIRPAVQALQDLGMHRKVQLIVSGGIRNGADVAKCLALGADAVSIGTAALIALGDNDPHYEDEYRALGSTAGAYDDWHEGRDPAGITTQDAALARRLDPVAAGRKLANYLAVLTLEAQTIARACGKSHVHNLEPEDLVALTSKPRRWRASRSRAPTGFRAVSGILSTEASKRSSGPKRQGERAQLMASLGEYAKQKGIKYFLVSFVDLFGTMRAKIVPATAIDAIAKIGSGLRRLRRLVRHDAGAPRHPRDAGPGQRHSTAVEARGRLGDRRSDHGRQGRRAESAPGAQARRSPRPRRKATS